jgi:hypothetical protein
MQVFTAQVKSNADLNRTGVVKAFCGEINADINVLYTSPYHAVNEGGFFAPPTVGSYILIAGNLEQQQFFYISTIVSKLANSLSPKDNGTRPKKFQEVKDVDKIYGKSSIPQQIRFTDYKGNGLLISNKYIKEKKRPDLRTQLQTFKGKVVALNDSPETDMINIETAHGDGIFIVQGKKNKAYGYRSINVKTRNALNLTSLGLAVNMTVVEGQDINIRNLSFGLMGLFPAQLPRQVGNVNIHSRWRDINIWTNGPQGAIIIRTPLARIQIEPNGRIYIAGATVDINANTINMNAAAGINMTSVGPINIQSATETNIVGLGRINLNDPSVTSVNPLSLAPGVISGYEAQS